MNKSSLFWICGNQRQSSQTWNLLLNTVKERSGQEANVESLLCGFNSHTATAAQRWTDTNDVIKLLRNRDMFDLRPRIIKLRGLPEDYTELIHYMDEVNLNNMLVFYGPCGYYKPSTKRWVTSKTTKLYKHIKSKGMVIEHPLEARNKNVGASWVIDVAQEERKKINDDVAQYLVECEGRNLDILTNSVVKLATYQKNKTITREDVDACCSHAVMDTVWIYLDHLDAKHLDPALTYLQSFYREGDGTVGESFYGRVSMLFGAILQHFLFLMIVKDSCGQQLNMKSVENAARYFYKTTPSKIKELIDKKITKEDLTSRFSPQFINMNSDKLGVRNTLQTRKSVLYAILADVYECMLLCRMRSGDPWYIKLCLDTFTMLACGKINSCEAARVRGREFVVKYNKT